MKHKHNNNNDNNKLNDSIRNYFNTLFYFYLSACHPCCVCSSREVWCLSWCVSVDDAVVAVFFVVVCVLVWLIKLAQHEPNSLSIVQKK